MKTAKELRLEIAQLERLPEFIKKRNANFF